MTLIAKTVKVVHQTVYDRNGRANLTSAKPIIQKIKHAYIDGRISTITGDVWRVVENPNKKESDYITVG